MKKYDIVALGEILIDYTPLPKSENGMEVFEQNAGGAPANVLACCAKFGLKTAFIGKVGDDNQGKFLKNTLIAANIETKGLLEDENYFTTLAFVSLADTGERSFSFSRKHSADINLKKEEVDTEILENANIFHFGSLSLTHEDSRNATIFAIEYAKIKGSIISYDPNYRELLWKNKETACKTMQSVLDYIDIIKISDEETELMTGEKSPKLAMEILLKKIPVVAITLGENGCLIGNSQGVIEVNGYKAPKIADTTGAGDSFWGAMLYKLNQSLKTPKDLTLSELEQFAKFSNATASICVGRRGAIAAMPKLEEVTTILK